MSAKRALDEKEIQGIFQAGKTKRHSIEWPGSSDMVLLAKAVNGRKQLVEFANGSVFTIRYDNESRMIFISPSNESLFVPCGYFEYDKLKGIV